MELPLIEASALQWKMIVEYVLQSAKYLPHHQYLEIKYEDFVTQPQKIFEIVGATCNLNWKANLMQTIVGELDNRNYKWQANLQDQDKNKLNLLLGGFLRDLGYEL